MNRGIVGGIIALVLIGLFVLYSSLFTVHQTQQALVLQFGRVVDSVVEPGLHFKLPFVQNVVYLDRRILDLDSPAQEVIAADQKRLVVDAFARYRIEDPLKFYQSVGSIPAANNRLASFMASAVRRVLGESTFQAVVRDERPALMARIARQVNAQAEGLGVEIVDVRIRRADLPEANSVAIYQRMQTERQQEAAEIRAQGEEAARRIQSLADRNAAVVVAEANRDAEQLRGVGDAERNRIFAEAYSRDEDFFSFYRSMQALETALDGDTRLVISPDSELFRYFGSPDGAERAAVEPRAPAVPRTADPVESVPPAPEAEGVDADPLADADVEAVEPVAGATTTVTVPITPASPIN